MSILKSHLIYQLKLMLMNINRYLKNTVGHDIKLGEYPYDDKWDIILSKQSDKIEILIGKYKTTISKDSNFLYRPI